MARKWKILIGAVLGAALLTLGSVAVLAQDEPAEKTATRSGLFERVAQILDIPREDLVNAFKQAREEMQAERQAGCAERWDAFWANGQAKALAALDKAVDRGLVSAAEADDIEAWWADRPQAIDKLGEYAFCNRLAVLGFLKQSRGAGIRELAQAALDKAVENDIITAAEAQDITDWWEARPEAVDKLGGYAVKNLGAGHLLRQGWGGEGCRGCPALDTGRS